MQVGVQLIFQNHRGSRDDGEIVANEVRTALAAEELGFHKVWPVEHHFTDYSACPDNAQFLTGIAARTERIRLATGAFILPWNNPLRVAEKIVLLDHMSGGRAVLGLGRGLSRVEYEGMGIGMGESRDRFDEAARMILDALDKGFIEGDGPYYPQRRTEIRPRPLNGFRERVYAIGMSPDSIAQAAQLGARLMVFSQMPWEQFAQTSWVTYKDGFAAHHEGTPWPLLCCDLMICDADAGRAEELARRHILEYYVTVMNHYELLGEHFKEAKGYEMYATASEILRSLDKDVASEVYLQSQAWGTPQQILDKLATRRSLVGDFELSVVVNYGSLPFDQADASLRLFASEVLPELSSW